MRNMRIVGIAAAMLLTAGTASAFEDIEINGELVAASDYVFRGVSQTDEDPAAQGGLSLSTSGFTLGTWASNVDEGAEVDVYASYGNNFKVVDYTAGVTHYTYTDDDFAEDYTELNLGLSTELLGGTVSVGFDWSPEVDEDFSGDEIDYKVYTIEYSYLAENLWELEFHGLVGYSKYDSDIVDFDYNNYNVGVSRSFATGPGAVKVSIDWHDTDQDDYDVAEDRIVGSVGYFF